MKVMTIVGTRPEIIKLAQTIKELDRHVTQVLVHTGQNYDYALNEVFFRDLELRKPDRFLEAAADTPAATIANVIARADLAMAEEKPDALLLYGDTNSCLAVIAAKRRKIPIFHMEAGNRCFDPRVPEEVNRVVVDHLADVNFVLSEHARRYLEREGVRPQTIIKTGSSLPELLAAYAGRVAASTVLADQGLRPREYFVVSAHREEGVDDPARLRALLASLRALADRYGFPLVFSVHPRTRARLAALGESVDGRVRLAKPFGFFDYIALQRDAFCVLSDSGTVTEESSLLGFPAVTTRRVHERPEGDDEGTVALAGFAPASVLRAVAVATDQFARGFVPRPVADYRADRVSAKVARLIVGYTGYVDEFVWRKAP